MTSFLLISQITLFNYEVCQSRRGILYNLCIRCLFKILCSSSIRGSYRLPYERITKIYQMIQKVTNYDNELDCQGVTQSYTLHYCISIYVNHNPSISNTYIYCNPSISNQKVNDAVISSHGIQQLLWRSHASDVSSNE